MRVRVKEGHRWAGAVGRVEQQGAGGEAGNAVLTDACLVHLDGEEAPRWIRRDALEEEREGRTYPKVGARVRVNQGGFRGRWGSVQQVDLALGEVLVALTGRSQPIWFLVEAVDEPEEEESSSRVPARVVVVREGPFCGSAGFVTQQDAERGEVLVCLDGGVKPKWISASDVVTVETACAFSSLRIAAFWPEALKLKVAARERVEQTRKDMENLRRLVDASKADGPERYRIAPGWADAGRIGKRVAPDVEVGGTFYVPLVWEDQESLIGSGARPVFVPKGTLAPAVTTPPVAARPKNERLRGMIYWKPSLPGTSLWQGSEILSEAQMQEVTRRSNAWESLERLYQRMRDRGVVATDSTELRKIIEG